MVRKIIPSILSENVSAAQEKAARVEGLVDWIQVDIMDGKFVEREVFSSPIDLATLQWSGKKEAHLMVESPASYFDILQDLAYDRVYFHSEVIQDESEKFFDAISKYSFEKGVAINPETSWEVIEPYVDIVDVVLFMTVHPGKGGQKFIDDVLEKIKTFKEKYPTKLVQIDGGVNEKNIKRASQVGVDLFVVGTSLFSADPLTDQFKKLQGN